MAAGYLSAGCRPVPWKRVAVRGFASTFVYWWNRPLSPRCSLSAPVVRTKGDSWTRPIRPGQLLPAAADHRSIHPVSKWASTQLPPCCMPCLAWTRTPLQGLTFSFLNYSPLSESSSFWSALSHRNPFFLASTVRILRYFISACSGWKPVILTCGSVQSSHANIYWLWRTLRNVPSVAPGHKSDNAQI